MTESVREQILKEGIKLTTGDRNKTYGSPHPNLTIFAHLVNAYLKGLGWEGEKLDSVDGGIIMVLAKVSRVAVNKDHHDNYVDMATYGAIVGECAVKNKSGNQLIRDLFKPDAEDIPVETATVNDVNPAIAPEMTKGERVVAAYEAARKSHMTAMEAEIYDELVSARAQIGRLQAKLDEQLQIAESRANREELRKRDAEVLSGVDAVQEGNRESSPKCKRCGFSTNNHPGEFCASCTGVLNSPFNSM